MNRTHLSTILCLSVCFSVVAASATNTQVALSSPTSNPRSEGTLSCPSERELGDRVNDLGSRMDGPAAFAAQNSLVASGRTSVQCRRKVIGALLGAMGQSPVDRAAENRKYILFHNGGRVLAQLKGTEALDVLLTNLTLTDELSISIGHFPAVLALIDIGEAAIPKLQGVLYTDSESDRRRFAAFCIASIGGARARRSLRKALATEKDDCVSKLLRTSLELFDNGKRPNHISPGDARFLGRFYCAY